MGRQGRQGKPLRVLRRSGWFGTLRQDDSWVAWVQAVLRSSELTGPITPVDNGIEQGHLSILAEAHYLLHHTAGLENKAVADLFDEWNGTNAKGGEDEKAGEGKEGKELYDNFLLKVGPARGSQDESS